MYRDYKDSDYFRKFCLDSYEWLKKHFFQKVCQNKAKLITHLDFQNLYPVYIIIAFFVTFGISDTIIFFCQKH